MKVLIVLGILAFNSVLAVASPVCESENAKAHLTEAKELNKDLKSCKTLECATVKVSSIEDKMCDAAEACKDIAYDLYFPCSQQMQVDKDNYQEAHKYLRYVIKSGLKAL